MKQASVRLFHCCSVRESVTHTEPHFPPANSERTPVNSHYNHESSQNLGADVTGLTILLSAEPRKACMTEFFRLQHSGEVTRFPSMYDTCTVGPYCSHSYCGKSWFLSDSSNLSWGINAITTSNPELCHQWRIHIQTMSVIFDWCPCFSQFFLTRVEMEFIVVFVLHA